MPATRAAPVAGSPTSPLHVHRAGQLGRHPLARLDRRGRVDDHACAQVGEAAAVASLMPLDDPVTMIALPDRSICAPPWAGVVDRPAQCRARRRIHGRATGLGNVACARPAEVGAGGHDLVDGVEQLVVEHDVGGAELPRQVLGGAGADDGRPSLTGWFNTNASAMWTSDMPRSSASLARASAASSFDWFSGNDRS